MNQFGIFAKYWEPGQTKTRLGAAIGYEEAAWIARAFIDCLLWRFRKTGDRRVLAITPPESIDIFKSLLGNDDWIVAPQSEGDLGARMRDYFQSALAAGANRVVLLGSDSPTLPLDHVEWAFEMLATKPVVLGPTRDGGYYLVGIAGEVPPIFEEIGWSTEAVFEQTAERLRSAGLEFGCLPEWYDVDEAHDLERLRRELDALAESDQLDRALKQLRREIEPGFAHYYVAPRRPTPGDGPSQN